MHTYHGLMKSNKQEFKSLNESLNLSKTITKLAKKEKRYSVFHFNHFQEKNFTLGSNFNLPSFQNCLKGREVVCIQHNYTWNTCQRWNPWTSRWFRWARGRKGWLPQLREDLRNLVSPFGRTQFETWTKRSVFSGEKKMHEESGREWWITIGDKKSYLLSRAEMSMGLREVVCCRIAKEKSGGEEKKPSRHPSHPITVAQILAWRGISALLYNSLGGHFRPIKH